MINNKIYNISIYFLIGIFFIITFLPTFNWMIERFNERESHYSHGYFIPLLVMFLIWQKKDILKKVEMSSSVYGLILIILGLVLHILGGIIWGIGFISGVSMIIVLIGIVLYLFGAEVTKVIFIPLIFLLLMVPIPKILLIGITFKMKILAAKIASFFTSLLNLNIENSGSFIYLPNGVLTIGNECSGINSLISLLTLSIFFAYIFEKKIINRIILISLALPIALISNIIRIIFLILVAYIYGIAATTKDIIHYGAGVLLWCFALATLFFIRDVLANVKK